MFYFFYTPYRLGFKTFFNVGLHSSSTIVLKLSNLFLPTVDITTVEHQDFFIESSE